MNPKIVLILLIKSAFLTISHVAGILTRPITENPVFGCHWHGSTLACNCHPDAEVFHLQENSINSIYVTSIELSECNAVIFDKSAIKTIRSLREIRLDGIKNLTLEEFGFAWDGYVQSMEVNTPTLRVSIRNSHIDRIATHAFSGRISEITLQNTTVANMHAFAFSTLVLNQRIDFTNVRTENVHPQAFKKFTTGQLTITGSNVTYLPSRTFSELTVNENLLIRNTTFGTVKSGAFLIHNPDRFEITDSEFDTLEGEAFRVMTRGDVIVRNVYFDTIYPSAFSGISVNLAETITRKSITINSPVFNSFDRDTLAINSTSFDLRLVNVLVNNRCDCENMEIIFSDVDQIEELYCLDDVDSYMNYVEYKNKNCMLYASNAVVIIVVCVTLILLIIVGAGLWCFFMKVYKCDRYGGEDKKEKLSMIVPDGRTYRETELHVIVERTDLLTTNL